MTNKHMQRCSIALVSREIQIKTINWYFCISITMAKNEKVEMFIVGEDEELMGM